MDDGEPRGPVPIEREPWRPPKIANNAKQHLEPDSDTSHLFQLAMSKAAVGMVMTGPEGDIFEVNHAFSAILGYPPHELRMLRWQDITHPDDLATGEGLVAQIVAGHIDSYRIQKRYICRDASVIWGDLSVSCIREPNGAVQFLIAQLVDVTESVSKLKTMAEAEASYRFLLGSVSDMMLRSDPETVTEWVSPSVTEVLGGLTQADAQIHARDALAESERRFRLMAATSSDVVVLAEPNRSVRWISPSIERNLGWTPADLVGTALADLLHPEDWAATEHLRAQVYSGDPTSKPFVFVSRMRTKSGEYRWISAQASPIKNDVGELVGVATGIRDVHDLMVARREAEEGKARLQATLDSLLDPSVLLQAVRDESGTLVDFIYADANDAACEYNRMTKEELLGTRLLELLPGLLRSGTFHLYANAIATGEPLILDDFAYSHEILGVERRYDIRAARVGDALSLSWRDVTDRHRALEELRASEEQFRLLAQNSTDVVVRKVADKITWVSPSMIDTLGWHPNEWLGTSGLEFVHPDDQEWARGIATCVAAGDVDIKRLRMRAKGGAYHWVDIRTHPYRDATGQIDGSVASMRTVDAEVASERELKRRAQYDSLTGILSRKEAFNRVAALFAHPPRLGGRNAVLFCDIDSFKQINDTLGHAAGDYVLSVVAERVASNVRESDVVGRIGGDELLVVLAGVHDLAEASNVAEKLRRSVGRPTPLPGRSPVDVTVSIGVTLVTEFDTVDSAVARADRAMYLAKQSGANQVVTG